MIDFEEWRDGQTDGVVLAIIQPKEPERTGLTTFDEWQMLGEGASHTRYSVEVNYRTTADEAMESFAKIALGYVSAALKNYNYQVKHVYTEKPVRILVSSRNWDDGEWVGVVSWNPTQKCFVVSKGFYNKDRRSVSIQSSEKCNGEDASEITKHLHNVMHSLKGKPDRWKPKLKPVPLKRGPKS
jgi:hypothetical protein